MLHDYVTITEASKIVGREVSVIRRKIRTREQYAKRERNTEVFIVGETAFMVGKTWLLDRRRLIEIYGGEK